MKTCDCGGMLYRHGTTRSKRNGEATRFRCKECGKCITVRGGKVVNWKSRIVQDWRMVA